MIKKTKHIEEKSFFSLGIHKGKRRFYLGLKSFIPIIAAIGLFYGIYYTNVLAILFSSFILFWLIINAMFAALVFIKKQSILDQVRKQPWFEQNNKIYTVRESIPAIWKKKLTIVFGFWFIKKIRLLWENQDNPLRISWIVHEKDDMVFNYPGCYKVIGIKLIFIDPLYLISFGFLLPMEHNYRIVPPMIQQDKEIAFIGGGYLEDYENLSIQKALDSDYYDIREYTLGDDTRRIHWKLSAKADKLMIRKPEASTPPVKILDIYIDHLAAVDIPAAYDFVVDFLSRVQSILLQMLKNHYILNVETSGYTKKIYNVSEMDIQHIISDIQFGRDPKEEWKITPTNNSSGIIFTCGLDHRYSQMIMQNNSSSNLYLFYYPYQSIKKRLQFRKPIVASTQNPWYYRFLYSPSYFDQTDNRFMQWIVNRRFQKLNKSILQLLDQNSGHILKGIQSSSDKVIILDSLE